jgi:hypothetical protein
MQSIPTPNRNDKIIPIHNTANMNTIEKGSRGNLNKIKAQGRPNQHQNDDAVFLSLPETPIYRFPHV